MKLAAAFALATIGAVSGQESCSREISFESGFEGGNPSGIHGKSTFTVVGGRCALEGQVRVSSGQLAGTGTATVAHLPEECRPSKRLIFGANNHGRAQRLDVLPSGDILLLENGGAYDFVSLSGIEFVVAGTSETPFNYNSNWKDFGQGYGTAGYTVIDGVCFVEGLAQTANYQTAVSGSIIGNLPVNCRPASVQIFSLTHHTNTYRVDVTPGGNVVFNIHGFTPPATSWVSLAGISFAVASTSQSPVQLEYAYTSWGGGYGNPNWSVDGNYCKLSGLAKARSGSLVTGTIGYLPAECRPDRQLVFNVQAANGPERIDVKPNGVIHFTQIDAHGAWVSLSNIQFLRSDVTCYLPTPSPTPSPTAFPTLSPTPIPLSLCEQTTCTYTELTNSMAGTYFRTIISTTPGTENFKCGKVSGSSDCACYCHGSYKCTLDHHTGSTVKSFDHC